MLTGYDIHLSHDFIKKMQQVCFLNYFLKETPLENLTYQGPCKRKKQLYISESSSKGKYLVKEADKYVNSRELFDGT